MEEEGSNQEQSSDIVCLYTVVSAGQRCCFQWREQVAKDLSSEQGRWMCLQILAMFGILGLRNESEHCLKRASISFKCIL